MLSPNFIQPRLVKDSLRTPVDQVRAKTRPFKRHFSPDTGELKLAGRYVFDKGLLTGFVSAVRTDSLLTDKRLENGRRGKVLVVGLKGQQITGRPVIKQPLVVDRYEPSVRWKPVE